MEELEGVFRSKMEAELQRLQALDEAQRKVEAARRYIEEEVRSAHASPHPPPSHVNPTLRSTALRTPSCDAAGAC